MLFISVYQPPLTHLCRKQWLMILMILFTLLQANFPGSKATYDTVVYTQIWRKTAYSSLYIPEMNQNNWVGSTIYIPVVVRETLWTHVRPQPYSCSRQSWHVRLLLGYYSCVASKGKTERIPEPDGGFYINIKNSMLRLCYSLTGHVWQMPDCISH